MPPLNPIVTAILVSDLVARRSPVLDSPDRSRLRLRSAAFASVGLSPAVGAAVTAKEVRRLERERPALVKPSQPPDVDVQVTVERIAEELTAATERVAANIERSDAQLKEDKEAAKAREEATRQAKAQLQKLQNCAKSFGDAVG